MSGRCTCGRNRYMVHAPPVSVSSSPSPPFIVIASQLLLPLTWYHSATYASFPDETHHSIRRSYAHPDQPGRRQYFCGFCGTRLLSWYEDSEEEDGEEEKTQSVHMQGQQETIATPKTRGGKEWVHLPLSSLDEGYDGLLERGLIIESEAGEAAQEPSGKQSVTRWMTEGGRVRGWREKRESNDGSMTVEWEVVEWSSAENAERESGSGDGGAIKRKISDMETSDQSGPGDLQMRD